MAPGNRVCQNRSPARDVFSSVNNLRLNATRTTEINPCLQFFGHHRWITFEWNLVVLTGGAVQT
ncbi:unnamed protein product [Penicillium roqueforti FM164]|uniref:Genomic scaffold, ProqFM164S02 n=1 Tax=Penicillium roqueforti (strain FM164) TaxID=1365484 RepID=W6Q8P1_PENRF|nr:unnamed protein product [Penicillium roqueforti FM164]